MNDRWTERLSEYLDGDLAARDRTALEAHLEGCATCRDALAALKLVVERAGALPPLPPTTDLWPQVAARIGSTRPQVASRGWRLSLSAAQAFGFAALLVVVSAGGAWWMVGQAPWLVTRGPSATGEQPLGANAGPSAPSPTPSSITSTPMTASAAFTDPRYDATVAELQRILEQERARLDPNTIKVLEKNLKIIDRAVADARRAVDADPSSQYLREHLASMMEQKMELLRQATQLAGQG